MKDTAFETAVRELRAHGTKCLAQRHAAWETWRRKYPELSDFEIANAIAEAFDASDRSRYRFYKQAPRKELIKILPESGKEDFEAALYSGR